MRLIGMGERALQLLVQASWFGHGLVAAQAWLSPPVSYPAWLAETLLCPCHAATGAGRQPRALGSRVAQPHSGCPPTCCRSLHHPVQRSKDRVAFKQQLYRHQSVRLDIARSRIELDAARWVHVSSFDCFVSIEATIEVTIEATIEARLVWEM